MSNSSSAGDATAAGQPKGAPIRLLVLGAGGRGGHAYAGWCLEHPDQARVVAIADPDVERRTRVGEAHGIPESRRFTDWTAALAEPGPWDAVVVATPDREHVDPTIRALELGYYVLLEKPVAPTPEDLERLAEAAKARPGAITVSHVMRYAPFYAALRRVLDEGRIGELQGIQHLENIAYWHFAHSYVRGNWHRTEDSSPMLLAKACHDLDMLRWLVGEPCVSVASFGERRHFRREHAPAGSTERCIDGCAVADTCPYNAERFYIEQLASIDGPPVTAITNDTSPEGRRRALETTDYGRCVYRMDNDVVDHQTTALRFANGVTASVVVSAFTQHNTRTITLMGSHGQINGDARTGRIETISFVDTPPNVAGLASSPATGTLQVDPQAGSDVEEVSEAFAGHGGGDAGLMADFTQRVRRWRDGEEFEAAPTSLEESLESHWVAFAAERSRTRGTVEHP
ncbi:Gfo/Idh/MocA family protein [Phytoactinopolyspora halotolerans]|uniref:Gfo/Idh/MocA family oxidoreductase n=1 Tax=Phytoactinopolyspora halotolerans TaxID=1981512 RepID=A0A6L9S881_9ACTN|nr:Gfo/Idh/MocA family oxidoreductase [Phytoactinopolyspora halotolerans]NEE01257.1 Gfo/Idh/MocA family oxidoreductase [Phytoactinopolyspora halotolerans]